MEIAIQFSNWLKSEGKSPSTIRVYCNALNKLMIWYQNTEGQSFEPAKITTLHLHEFQSYLNKTEKLEPPTINKLIASLKTFFKFALEMGAVFYDPTQKIKMKRTMTQYAAPKWLSKQECAKFFHEIVRVKNEKQKARDLAICRLMAGAGLRVQEVSDLTIDDICLEKRRENVTIRDGKGGKFRIVPLNPDIIESLNDWFSYREVSNLSSPCFITERNSPMGVRSIHYLVVKYSNKAGLENVSPHTLRHTFCKSLFDQGVGLEQVAYLAGHDSLETTRRYTQPSENDLRRAINSISEKK